MFRQDFQSLTIKMKQRSLRLVAFILAVLSIGLPAPGFINAVGQSRLVNAETAQPHPANLDFEDGVVGQVPSAWTSPTGPTFVAELTEQEPKSGKRCGLLRSSSNAADGPQFGNLMQAFDATPFRGRRVRFRAAVRTKSEEGARAQLWMRVDRDGKRGGFFDNMGDRPIFSAGWQYYEITGDVDEDATVINIGMILIGKGQAWLDDVSFVDLGKIVVLAEPARPLGARGLENLSAFTRLLGYVRHFHPSDEAAAADWESFTVSAVRDIEGANDPAALATKLEALFRPVAPTVRVFVTGAPPRLPQALSLPANDSSARVTSWRHKGFGQKNTRSIYQSERVTTEAPGGRVPPNSPDPGRPFLADLGGGVSCLVPLALFVDARGTLPHVAVQSSASKNSLIKYSGNDRATRLADVALAWNIFQHFYPYFDVAHADWPQVLKESLIAAASDRDEVAFLGTLRRLVAQLHDGHGGVYHPSESFQYSYPVIFGWIENSLVITDVAATGAEGLQPGDVVLKVDGRPGAEAIAETEAIISGATPQWRRYVALSRLRMQNSEMTLEVRDSRGQTRSVTLRRNVEAEGLVEMRPPKVTQLKPGIFYLDLDRIKDEDFQVVLPQLEKARGIIFDLRGYPKVSPVIISHLTNKPVESARWMVPIVTQPDRLNIVEYNTEGRWKLEPIVPRLTAKIAFLTDGRAISYAESYLGIIEAYKLADIVGEPTAGTNGNINPFMLPGNYNVVWTGMKVLKNDGSQHHGVGIQPTVPVSRTIRGVAERRDEQLERAIALVSQ